MWSAAITSSSWKAFYSSLGVFFFFFKPNLLFFISTQGFLGFFHANLTCRKLLKAQLPVSSWGYGMNVLIIPCGRTVGVITSQSNWAGGKTVAGRLGSGGAEHWGPVHSPHWNELSLNRVFLNTRLTESLFRPRPLESCQKVGSRCVFILHIKTPTTFPFLSNKQTNRLPKPELFFFFLNLMKEHFFSALNTALSISSLLGAVLWWNGCLCDCTTAAVGWTVELCGCSLNGGLNGGSIKSLICLCLRNQYYRRFRAGSYFADKVTLTSD